MKSNLRLVPKPEEPPQGLHVPSFTPIILDKKDAAEFYAKLEEVRKLLPEDQKHFLKKDREIAELQNDNTTLIGARNESGELIGGVMVMLPVTRMIAKKYEDYPWDGLAETTALLSGLWTDANYRGKGLAVANIQKVLEIAKATEVSPGRLISNVVSGVVQGNPVAKSFTRAHFTLAGEKDRPAQGDQPAHKAQFYRATFYIPDRRAVPDQIAERTFPLRSAFPERHA